MEPEALSLAITALVEVRLRDERASTMDACREFQSRFGHHAAGGEIYGDASGALMQTAGSTDYEIISEFLRSNGYQYSFRVPRSNPPVRDRVTTVNSMFQAASGDVRLYVSKRCKELIKDFEQVGYQPNTTMIDKMSDPKRTHLSDAVGYLLWQERRAQEAGERGERLL